MSETSEEKPSPHSIIIKALSELVRAGESPDTERWANVRRDVVCREVIKIRDANDAQRKELASLRSTVKEQAEQLHTVHSHVAEALELLGVDISVNGYIPDPWTLREQCKIAGDRLAALTAENDRLRERDQQWQENTFISLSQAEAVGADKARPRLRRTLERKEQDGR